MVAFSAKILFILVKVIWNSKFYLRSAFLGIFSWALILRSAFYQRFEVRQESARCVLLGPLSLKCATTDAANALIIQLNGAPTRLRKVDFPSLSGAAKSSREFPSHFTNSKWPPLSARAISPLICHHTKSKVAHCRPPFLRQNFLRRNASSAAIQKFSKITLWF